MVRQMLKHLASDFEFLNHRLINIYLVYGVASLKPNLKNVVECLTRNLILLMMQKSFIRDFVPLGIHREISECAWTSNSQTTTFALSEQINQSVAFIRECLYQRTILIRD